MVKNEIKNRILMEMGERLGINELKALKECLDRNFYNVEITNNTAELMVQNVSTNEQLLSKFSFEKKLEGCSNKTIVQYIRETKKFFSMAKKHCTNITADDINYYLAMLLKKGNSPTSVDNARKFIKAFFKWLYENEYIRKDIFIKIKPIKRVDKRKEYLTEEEIVKIRDTCNEDKRALALVDFLLSTGVRVSECSNLKIDNVNFATGEVNIYATKTNEWRKVYLDPNALKHVGDYLNSRTDTCPYLFVNNRKTNGKIDRMQNGSIERLLQMYCKRAKIHKHCHVHLFRKTLATRLHKRGLDMPIIAKLLGHKSINTTERFYLSICDQDVMYMYQKCA